jgi:hypothetical protein
MFGQNSRGLAAFIIRIIQVGISTLAHLLPPCDPTAAFAQPGSGPYSTFGSVTLFVCSQDPSRQKSLTFNEEPGSCSPLSKPRVPESVTTPLPSSLCQQAGDDGLPPNRVSVTDPPAIRGHAATRGAPSPFVPSWPASSFFLLQRCPDIAHLSIDQNDTRFTPSIST